MTNGDALGYYEVLEVSPDAGGETVKQQYHLLAKKWHPDRNPDPSAADRFQKISAAYNIMKDEKSRLLYDILSEAYDGAHFPDMNNLKIYSARNGNQEVDLRHIKLTRITGKLAGHGEKKIAEICNYNEARQLALRVSVYNWLLGWWGLTAIPANIQAITNNYKKILSDYAGNFTLLAHNMLAYAQEQHFDEAYASGRLALRYASPRQKQLVEQFLDNMPHERDYIYPQWKAQKLKAVQLLMPLLFIIGLGFAGSVRTVSMAEFQKLWLSDHKINYFQEVRFRDGGSTVDDLAVSKVVAIPVDIEDMSKLYHVKEDIKVMYGPDKNFDVLKELPAKTTVRLTGYTPDERWVRIMIDNGEMGFVPYDAIRKGIGRDIPEDSKIYQH